MGLFDRVASLFLPPFSVQAPRSSFADRTDAIRLERPLQTASVQRLYQADIEDAIAAADAGDFSLLSQLSQAVGSRDSTASGLLATRTSGLTRLPKLFRGTPRIVRALENRDGETGLFDRIFAPKELALFIRSGILNGIQLGELIPLPDRPEPVFANLDIENLRYEWGSDRWLYYSVGGVQHVCPGDGRWILGLPGGLQNPWKNALWGMFRAYVAKDHAFHFREAYSSALAQPARVAYAPAGSDADERQGMLQKLIQWGVNAAFVLPIGWRVELLELSSGTTHKVFQETIDSADKELIMQLSGQLVSTTGGTGFTTQDMFETIRKDIIQDDGDHTCHILNEQGLRPIVNRMYGGGEHGTVEIDTTPPANLKADAESIKSAMDAIEATNARLKEAGSKLRVDMREMLTRYRIPTIVVEPSSIPSMPPANDTAPQKPALSLVKPEVA